MGATGSHPRTRLCSVGPLCNDSGDFHSWRMETRPQRGIPSRLSGWQPPHDTQPARLCLGPQLAGVSQTSTFSSHQSKLLERVSRPAFSSGVHSLFPGNGAGALLTCALSQPAALSWGPRRHDSCSLLQGSPWKPAGRFGQKGAGSPERQGVVKMG